jgi:hypothetical protein
LRSAYSQPQSSAPARVTPRRRSSRSGPRNTGYRVLHGRSGRTSRRTCSRATARNCRSTPTPCVCAAGRSGESGSSIPMSSCSSSGRSHQPATRRRCWVSSVNHMRIARKPEANRRARSNRACEKGRRCVYVSSIGS